MAEMTEIKQLEQLKAAGNKEFSKGRLELALQCYTNALDINACDSSMDESSIRCTKARICGNRSLVHAKLGKLQESLQDASMCVSLDKAWPKGYFRLGMAFQALKQSNEALMSFELGLSFLTDATEDDQDEKLRNDFVQQISSLQKKDTFSTTTVEEVAVTQPVPMASASRIAVTLKGEDSSLIGPDEGVPNIIVRNLEKGVDNRGVFASRALSAGQVVLAVPRELLLTLQVAREGGIRCRQLDVHLHAPSGSKTPSLQLLSPNHSLLAVFMLEDEAKGPEHSRFWAYYQSLPRDLSNMPVFWSEEELKWLEGSRMLQRIEDRKISIQSDYSDIVRVVPLLGELASLEEFMAMRLLVNSRVFATEIDGFETMTMVPLADMLNHRRPPQTAWRFDQDAQAFLLTATEDISAGEELFDSYGAKCNSRYLLNYGFTSEHNKDLDGTCHNEITFDVSLDPQDPCYKTKAGMMRAGREHTHHSRPESGSKDNMTLQLSMSMHFETMSNLNSFCYGRFLFATPRDLPSLPRALPPSSEGFTLRTEKERGNLIMPISVANETAVLRLFKEKALAQLALYATSLEEDYARRPSLIPLSNAWNACNLLIGEKEVCQYLIDMSDACCRLLAMSLKDATNHVQARKAELRLQAVADEVQNEIIDYMEKICIPLVRKDKAAHR